MIKDFMTICDSDIKYIQNHRVTIYEKLDMIYFRVNVYPELIIPRKAPRFSAITDVDQIVNTVNKEIVDWCYEHIYPLRKEICQRFGNVEIGFFYAPVQKTRVINYTNIKTPWICFSDVSKSRGTEEEFENFLDNMPLSRISPINADVSTHDITPIPGDPIGTIDKLMTACNTEYNGMESLKSILPMDISEGIVIRSGNKQWQIILNDSTPHVIKEGKKIYRDKVLASLAKEVVAQTDIIEQISDDRDYISKVCTVFEAFMNTTDIFSKIKFDPEDLLPPIEGYIGDVDLEALSKYASPSTITICKYNETAKNILRLFLHTFTHTINERKFCELTPFEQTQLNSLTKALNYRNYAEIALTVMTNK